MDIVEIAVGNPLNEDDLEEDSDAVLAPDLLLVRAYGGKLMQLGPFMPALLIFMALMNGYSRNDEFMPWEQESHCRVDEAAPFFKACEEDYEASGGDPGPWGFFARDHCQAAFCHVGDELVHTDHGVIGSDHREQLAPWTPGQPCPSGWGQRCFNEGELDPLALRPLNVMYRSLAGVGSLFIGAVSFSLRRVTAPGGTLELLGLGEAKILARQHQRLQRWQIALGAAILGVFGFGLMIVTLMTFVMQGFRKEPWLVLLEVPMYWFVWPCAFSWYLALKEASVLVSDAVLEARKEVASTAVVDDKWDESVVPKILELAKTTLPDLSHGFGGGLFMCALGFWSFSASAFASALGGNWGVVSGLFRSFNLFCFPLLIALDVASASSDCDSLVNELNEKRKQTMNIETDQKLQVLERALSLENAG